MPGKMKMVMKKGKRVPAFAADGKGKMAKGGMTKAKMMAGGGKAKMMAGGGMTSKMAPSKMGKVATGKPSMGSASSRADGVAEKGLTKGRMLRKGGKVI